MKNKLAWLPSKVLKARTSDQYPKMFYLGLIYEFSSRFIEDSQMEEFITEGRDREAIEELETLGFLVKHEKKSGSGCYYEVTDFKTGTYSGKS